jgi:hypothetical protein
MSEPLYSEKQAAFILGVAVVTLRRRRRAGTIRFQRQGGRIFYSRQTLFNYQEDDPSEADLAEEEKVEALVDVPAMAIRRRRALPAELHPDDPAEYSIPEIAAILRIGTKAIKAAMAKNELCYLLRGQRRYLIASDVLAWQQRRRDLCLSSTSARASGRPTTTTPSRSAVVGFAAARARLIERKPSP